MLNLVPKSCAPVSGLSVGIGRVHSGSNNQRLLIWGDVANHYVFSIQQPEWVTGFDKPQTYSRHGGDGQDRGRRSHTVGRLYGKFGRQLPMGAGQLPVLPVADHTVVLRVKTSYAGEHRPRGAHRHARFEECAEYMMGTRWALVGLGNGTVVPQSCRAAPRTTAAWCSPRALSSPLSAGSAASITITPLRVGASTREGRSAMSMREHLAAGTIMLLGAGRHGRAVGYRLRFNTPDAPSPVSRTIWLDRAR